MMRIRIGEVGQKLGRSAQGPMGVAIFLRGRSERFGG